MVEKNTGNSPINWYGGKFYMRKEIISLFPPHIHYVEGFGGAGHLLFAKPPSQIETYNDIHEGLHVFFKVLKDKSKAEILRELLILTPYSRQEFQESLDWEIETDEIQKAKKFFISLLQSFGTLQNGFSYAVKQVRRNMSAGCSKWLNAVDINLPFAIERLSRVQIEKLDIIKLIKKYDTEDTLFYLDPPYVLETRKTEKIYKHEFSNEQHQQLIDTIFDIKGKVILSGYDHEIYNNILKNNKWNKNILKKHSICFGNNQSKKQIRRKVDEIIWKNF